jgi:hypothetical protein
MAATRESGVSRTCPAFFDDFARLSISQDQGSEILSAEKLEQQALESCSPKKLATRKARLRRVGPEPRWVILCSIFLLCHLVHLFFLLQFLDEIIGQGGFEARRELSKFVGSLWSVFRWVT